MIVTSDGRAKLLDFGLAKLTEVAAASPEQVEGRKVDARSDILSFGSVLYEMLTCRPAFRGENPAQTLARGLL